MPYEWSRSSAGDRLRLWPYRSLPITGFVWVIGLTSAGLALPLLAVVGRSVMWGLLPFAAAAVAGLWFAISRTYRSGEIEEIVTLTPDRISVTRKDPGSPPRSWSANPYWIRAEIRPGPVPSYLVLAGDHETGREIELGAFLTPEERRAIRGELARALARSRRA